MEVNKKISEMTEREILRKQLELLAEASQGYDAEKSPEYTKAMIEIYDRITVQHNYIPYEKSIKPEPLESTAERIGEQLYQGKISINQARKEFGLPSIKGGDIATIAEKRLVTMNEEKRLIELIISYAKQHNFTVSNIMEVVQKVREYMANNAVVVSEDCTHAEMQSSEERS